MAGLLLAFASSSYPTGGGGGGSSSGGGGGTIARSTATHLAGADRVNSANIATCLHRIAKVMLLPVHPGDQNNNDGNGGGPEWSRGGSGHC